MSVLVLVTRRLDIKSDDSLRFEPCSENRLVACLMAFPIYDDSQLEQLILQMILNCNYLDIFLSVESN